MSALPDTADRLAESRATLADRDAPLAGVLRAIRATEAASTDLPVASYGLTATCSTDLLATMLRRHALRQGVRADVHQGALDAHLDNVARFVADGVRHLVVLTTLDGLLPAFEARAATLDPGLLRDVAAKLRQETELVLDAARELPTVDVVLPHRLSCATDTPASRAVDAALAVLADAVREAVDAAPGARLFDAAAALAAVGHERAVDERFRLRFGAPYTPRGCDELARRLVLGTRAGGTFLPKALVLDCDNTLWGGILGEDGLDGIALDPHHYPGNAFWAVQHQVVALQRQGVLVCLASKNNPEDVAEALARHPAMILAPEHIVVSEIGWGDKVDALRRIAASLGIGLDSLVFVDDSPFELEAVRCRLPEVTVVGVPREPWAWPGAFGAIAERFAAGRADGADVGKTEQYRARAAAKTAEAAAGSREAFLASLGVQVEVRVDERAALARIAELTQKSNQFNLTTRRYGQGELAAAMDADDALVLSLHVADRFTDHGLVGVVVARLCAPVCEVEALLLSCRVLGRGVERAPWPLLARRAAEAGCSELRAAFLPTAKNAQVASFWDDLGLRRDDEGPDGTRYAAPLDALELPIPDHLEILQ